MNKENSVLGRSTLGRKKGNVAVMTIIIVILVITVGVIGWKIAKKSQTPTQEVATQTTTTTILAQENNAGVIYTNSEFGFQLTFPKSWENYKAVTRREKGTTYVYIDLPTSDKTWPGDSETIEGKSLMGYASMFAVSVWNVDAWNKDAADCKKDSMIPCRGEREVVGKGNGFVYEMTGPQAMPEDLQKSAGDKYVETIKNTFKIIPLTQNISNLVPSGVERWQTYKNEKYGFEMKYPSDWKLESQINSSTPADFGFYPVSFEKYPTCADYVKGQKNTPNEGESEYFARNMYCMISVKIEQNPNNLQIKEYLRKNYFDKTIDQKLFNDAINSLSIEDRGGIGISKSKKYAFLMADRSYAGGKPTPGVEVEYVDQEIINYNKIIIFINNGVRDEYGKEDSIFNKLIPTFKFTK